MLDFLPLTPTDEERAPSLPLLRGVGRDEEDADLHRDHSLTFCIIEDSSGQPSLRAPSLGLWSGCLQLC